MPSPSGTFRGSFWWHDILKLQNHFKGIANSRVANSSVAQTNEGSRTATAGNAAQTTTIVEAPPIEAPKKRGRKAGSRTKFKLPARGFKVALKPSGDE